MKAYLYSKKNDFFALRLKQAKAIGKTLIPTVLCGVK